VKRDALILVVVMALPSFMTWMEFMVLPGGHEEGNPVVLVLFGAGKIVQFALPLLYVWWFEPGRIRLVRPTSRGLALGAGFGLLVGVGAIGLYHFWLRHTPFMADTPRRVYAWLSTINLTTPEAFLGIALFVSIPHSFLEEYYWRWFVFGWLRRYVPEGAAMVVSSLAFMAHHVIILSVYLPGQFWTLAVPFSLCVAGGGIVWAWLYDRTGSLYAPWISHLLVDAALMVLGYEMVARFWVK
jgi:membrane protease YdiL (CAAX protease family)